MKIFPHLPLFVPFRIFKLKPRFRVKFSIIPKKWKNSQIKMLNFSSILMLKWHPSCRDSIVEILINHLESVSIIKSDSVVVSLSQKYSFFLCQIIVHYKDAKTCNPVDSWLFSYMPFILDINPIISKCWSELRTKKSVTQITGNECYSSHDLISR